MIQFGRREGRPGFAFHAHGAEDLAPTAQRHRGHRSAAQALQRLLLDADAIAGQRRVGGCVGGQGPAQAERLFDGFVHRTQQTLRRFGLRLRQVELRAGQQARAAVFVQTQCGACEAAVGGQGGDQRMGCGFERTRRQDLRIQGQRFARRDQRRGRRGHGDRDHRTPARCGCRPRQRARAVGGRRRPVGGTLRRRRHRVWGNGYAHRQANRVVATRMQPARPGRRGRT